jgi:hypothetical protein
MSIKIKITEKEILDKPNDSELGSYIRRKYLVQKQMMERDVDTLSLGQIPDDVPEKCLVCGKLSPYTKSTHIDLRTGYVEGMGQTCFNPLKCEGEKK